MKKLIKNVLDYIKNDYKTMNYYIDGEDPFYKTLFRIAVFICMLGMAIGLVFMYVGFPIWILPYLIYRIIKEKRNNRCL